MIWGKGYNETRFAGLTDFCMQFAQRLSQSRRLCSERDSLGSCEHMRTEADSFYTKCMRQQCHEVTGAGCAITAMSFFWEGHGDHLTQLSQLCRTQTLAQPSKRHILLGPCKISMQPFCKGTRIKGVFRLQIERLSEDIFERVTSFLEPRRPQHPAHAGAHVKSSRSSKAQRRVLVFWQCTTQAGSAGSGSLRGIRARDAWMPPGRRRQDVGAFSKWSC